MPQRHELQSLIAACMKDKSLRSRFVKDPAGVLAEWGMKVPPGIKISVVENSANHVHVVLPAEPSKATEVSDESLAGAAGGFDWGGRDTGCLKCGGDMSGALG